MISAQGLLAQDVIAQNVVAQNKVLFAGHGWHVIELLGFFLTSILGIWLGEAARRRPRYDAVKVRRQPLLWLVALFGAAAAGIHFDVMPEHFEESALYGSFFLVCALTQIAYSGWLVVARSRVLLAVGAIGNTALALLWLFTRTIEIPFGPAAGAKESFGALDVACSTLEILMAAGALVLLHQGRRERQPVTRVGRRPVLTVPPAHLR